MASTRLVAVSAVSLPLGLFIASSSLTAVSANSQSKVNETLTYSCGSRFSSSSGCTRGTMLGSSLSILATDRTSP